MRTNTILPIIAIILLGGCSMAPKLEIKNPELPTSTQSTSFTINAQWWKGFEDSRLNMLVDEALQSSDDLKLAIANVELAQASLGLATSERFPNITVAGDAFRQRTSAESFSPFAGFIYNNFGVSSTISYEFDFWGKLRNAERAAWSSLLASEADKETVRISLVSGVAELYIAQIAFEQKVSLLKATVDAYKESYDYRLREYSHGAIDELTVKQSQALYANAKVLLASIKEASSLNTSALSLTLGRNPKQLFEENIKAPLKLPTAMEIPVGIHSELLQRRPDILAAEERLRSANAQIGVAKANYFPSISLTGSLGLQSADLDNLLQSSARTWGFGPTLNMPLLDFGRVENTVRRTEAQQKIALINYAKTVKNAFKEVYDALENIKHSKMKIMAQEAELKALKNVLELSNKRFESGYGDYLNVLDAKRGLLDAQTAMIDLNADLIVNQITLYKALGGGWKRSDSKSIDNLEQPVESIN